MKTTIPLDPLFDAKRAEAGDPFPFESAVTGLVELTDGPIAFDPVPRFRQIRAALSKVSNSPRAKSNSSVSRTEI